MCTEKHVLIKKVYKVSSPLWSWVKNIVHEVETHWLSSKKKVLATVVSKEDHSDSLLGHERTLISLNKVQL